MQKKPPSSLCAGAAIAAALALGSTPALAQDVSAPVPTIAPPAPVAAAPVAAAPASALRIVETPVVQPLPAAPPAEAAPAARSQAPAASAQPRQSARPAPRAAAPVAVAAAPVAAVVPPAVTPRVPAVPVAGAPAPVAAAVAPVEPAPVAAPAAVPAESDGLTGTEAGFLALLAAAGLAGAGLLAMRARRRVRDEEPVEGAAVAQAVPVAAAVPLAAPEAERAAPVSARRAASPERFAMPSGPVPADGEERSALLARMIAAPPDEANPFVSRKRRAQRARILLAEREAALRDRSTEAFDWRTYRPTGANAPQATARPEEFAHDPT